jgi:hypothetical protein
LITNPIIKTKRNIGLIGTKMACIGNNHVARSL